jgi:dipeptidyl-peptidase-4
MGTPQSNPDGYDQGSNVRLADKLQGKLLITIGTADVNVTFNHTMRLINAFIKANKFYDLLVLPGESHAQTPAAQAYYIEARNRYLAEHLGARAAVGAMAGQGAR